PATRLGGFRMKGKSCPLPIAPNQIAAYFDRMTNLDSKTNTSFPSPPVRVDEA
mgnify:CR=1